MRGEPMPNVMRGVSPCTECGERHTLCHAKCPKDARGEFGYEAWKAEAEKIKEAKKAYAEETYQAYEEQKRRNKWGITHF